VTNQTRNAEERMALRTAAEQCLAPVRRPDCPLTALAPEKRAHVEQVAQDCAHLFQRSSSCVEGRNGQLAFWHQHLRRIRPRRLKAPTAVQNYFAPSSDGTTRAERFFGAKPHDLFKYLLRKVPAPPQPAAKRPRPPPQPVLATA
jgi:hypothetical protein